MISCVTRHGILISNELPHTYMAEIDKAVQAVRNRFTEDFRKPKTREQRHADRAREREFFANMDREDRERRRAYRMEREAEERAEKAKRDSFNSQHAKAPEGSVKELAAKYGKSIGEIRRLKAAGELHTLVIP